MNASFSSFSADTPNSNELSNENFTKMREQFFSFKISGMQQFIGPAAMERRNISDAVWKEFERTVQRKEDGYYIHLSWKKTP
ncbi:unnamed protein product [Heligmosomoides polygyrus]|uniref:Uncharacterized protein n=1 Tax=Heligmosomoides polygyrus TaxID=6339 RepID=A0A183GMN6_HELPZ|nr:unnamed protein product [Heligmosomoides polygyrus]